MRATHSVLGAAFCVVTLGVSFAQAQQQSQGQQQTPDQQQTPNQQQTQGQSEQPIPAYRSPFASAAVEPEDVGSQGTPDNRSLSGAQNLSPYLLSTRSYWQPQISAFGILDSNPSGTGSGTDWTAGAVVSGTVDVHRVSDISTMDLTYTGGGSFEPGYSTGVIQALGFRDQISFHRSDLSFLDQLSYLPGSAFGYGGLGGLPGTLPGSGSGLNPGLSPGQTIYAGNIQTLQNVALVQYDFNVSGRGTLTFAGGFYFQHYFSGDYLNSINPNFRAGYNYALTRKDTIAVIYTYGGYSYGNSTQTAHSQTAQFSYGRVVTQRLAFQIAAGPQWVISQIPLSVSGTPTTVSPTTQLGFALNAGLTLTNGRNSTGLGYYHWINPGSGVFAGSISDTFSGSFTRKSSRTFSSGISGGYSRNQGVTTTSGGAFANQTYDYWYAGARLSHAVGNFIGLSFSYWFQYQNNPYCVGTTCGANIVTNFFSFGFGWHPRAMAF